MNVASLYHFYGVTALCLSKKDINEDTFGVQVMCVSVFVSH